MFLELDTQIGLKMLCTQMGTNCLQNLTGFVAMGCPDSLVTVMRLLPFSKVALAPDFLLDLQNSGGGAVVQSQVKLPVEAGSPLSSPDDDAAFTIEEAGKPDEECLVRRDVRPLGAPTCVRPLLRLFFHLRAAYVEGRLLRRPEVSEIEQPHLHASFDAMPRHLQHRHGFRNRHPFRANFRRRLAVHSIPVGFNRTLVVLPSVPASTALRGAYASHHAT